MSNAASKNQKLFWLDLEMTGLDVNKEVIIEAAAIVTDYDFEVIDTYEAVVNQPQMYIDRMDDWNQKHHKESGLIQKIPYGKKPEEVEEDLMRMLKKHWPSRDKKDDWPILAGNSIMQDRIFLERQFKDVANYLHYRQLDVTSWKILFNNKFNIKYEKKNSHRALDDIKESIEELRFYMNHFDYKLVGG